MERYNNIEEKQTIKGMISELEFNNKRSCGLWLTLVGVVIIASLAFGGHFIVNPFIFLAGYYLSFFLANVNHKVRAKLSDGTASPFQIKIIYFGIALLFILMFLIAGPFIPSWNWKMIWLGVNLATGIHFLIFYFVHGRSMIVLGASCIAIAVSGYALAFVPAVLFLTADALIKFGFGIWMLFFSKPTRVIGR
ncbi:DUF6609 family protein [Eubacterium ruminantium]|uniref:DUF6609 family protein n=1 Tax=Eubacterium ruminantium TaxID=42322 RepID=UPI0023F1936E|nr:DUF6609 family protein [Eubacterium ruminantium]